MRERRVLAGMVFYPLDLPARGAGTLADDPGVRRYALGIGRTARPLARESLLLQPEGALVDPGVTGGGVPIAGAQADAMRSLRVNV